MNINTYSPCLPSLPGTPLSPFDKILIVHINNIFYFPY